MSLRLFGKNKEKKTRKELFFLKNGAAVLEQLISSLNGDCNPIRNYSAQQLKTATNSFHLDLINVNIANEVAIASRMSSHNNVLKLLGCCLETEWPILVYEYPKRGNLADCLNRTDRDVPLALEFKLRIAMKVANAVAYLHHGLSKKFIHGDIESCNIFLDQNFDPKQAKLFEFQWALSIPEGENHVQADVVFGTYGLLAPEAMLNQRYSEKSDVYAFGGLLYEILTKKKIHRFSLDFSVPGTSFQDPASGLRFCVEASTLLQEENRAQVMEAIKLMEVRRKDNPDDRPDMIEVAKVLRLITSS
ncbi:hypothetical protein UlMin_016156 [Ulmus minor]